MMSEPEEVRENEEEPKENNPGGKSTQTQLTLRVLVGGYLYYLIYQLLKGGALTANTGWHLAVMIGAMVLFAGFGGYFLVTSVIALIRHDYFDPNR